ncbi:MAG: carotenoid biosynthesis protein [Chloroflexi bacterium]|nr:carotenoid biosynthesis protein [Chloroflexota bacterium]
MPFVYGFLEGVTLVLFALTLLHAVRRGRRALVELVSAAVYGMLLELSDIAIFHSYHYNAQYALNIGWVPIQIGLTWALIMYGAMRLSDQLGFSARTAPFADALWAILLDLSFDAVAIRMGLWTWSIPLDAGYFGVPASNFYAWLLVALMFSAVTRGLRTKPLRWQWLAPFIAYPLMLAAQLPFVLATRTLYANVQGGGFELFVAATILFALVALRGVRTLKRTEPLVLDGWTTFLRWGMHLTFLVGLIAYRIYETVPFLLFVSLLALAAEAVLLVPFVADTRAHWRTWRARRPMLNAT